MSSKNKRKILSSNDLMEISKIIIEKKYPNSINYDGWFNAFPFKLNKEDDANFNLDFGTDKGMLALIFLATMWNMGNYSWENAIGVIGVLYKRDLLNVNDWCSKDFINSLDEESLKNEMNDFDLDKRKSLYIKSGKLGVFERLHKIACEYDYLKDILKIDDILLNKNPKLNSDIFYKMDDDRLKVISGLSRKMPLLRVKVPLILRELKCAGKIDVDDNLCSVPDSRVKEMMHIIGYKYHVDGGIDSVLKNSKIINQYYESYYDLPLFDYYDDCPKNACKGDSCDIFGYCGKNIKTSEETVQSKIC